MRASSLLVGRSRKYRRRAEGKPLDSTRRQGCPTSGRSRFLGGTGVERLGGRLLTAADDVDVDAGRTRLMDNMPQDRPAIGDVPPAALDRADDDLSDLMLPCGVADPRGAVVVVCLVPARTELARQLPQPVGRLAIAGQAGVAVDDVDHVEFS